MMQWENKMFVQNKIRALLVRKSKYSKNLRFSKKLEIFQFGHFSNILEILQNIGFYFKLNKFELFFQKLQLFWRISKIFEKMSKLEYLQFLHFFEENSNFFENLQLFWRISNFSEYFDLRTNKALLVSY